MKTLKTCKEGLFQGGGTNVLCDVRTCCSTSMQLLVEEQMFLGSKQWDNSVWSFDVANSMLCDILCIK